MQSQALRFLASRCPAHADGYRVVVTPIRSGLEAAVGRVRVDPPAHERMGEIPRCFVIKELRGGQRREAAIYNQLWRARLPPPAARVLGLNRYEDVDYLFLENVKSLTSWPWSDAATAAAVCRVLAQLHGGDLPCAPVVSDWDYEQELRQSAASTLVVATSARDGAGNRLWRRLGDLRRVVAGLSAIRDALLCDHVAFIHGDVHPGNVLVRRHGRAKQVVLIDWARARLGSPLEDIASWLHALGCWEPVARRLHDTLLQTYLDARGGSRRITASLRTHYWFASASNGLAGAIRYHLSVLSQSDSSGHLHRHSLRALTEWERVIRRVASILATIPPHRTI